MNRFQVRRATLDDLPQLRTLWQGEGLPADTLEKRFTEFQVVHNDKGEILACLGLEISGGHGRLHSEAIPWYDLADAMRTVLWPRLETIARNHGLARLWTTLEAPFWKGAGFKRATDEILSLLPPVFATESARWLTLPLRANETGPDDLDKQLAVLRAASRAEHERLIARAKVMRWIALGLIAVIFAVFALWVIYWVQLRAEMRRRRSRNQ